MCPLHQVILQKSEVESMMHSPGDYILLSADKYEIKVMSLSCLSAPLATHLSKPFLPYVVIWSHLYAVVV